VIVIFADYEISTLLNDCIKQQKICVKRFLKVIIVVEFSLSNIDNLKSLVIHYL